MSPFSGSGLPTTVSAAEVISFGYVNAVQAIENALRAGLNPADDPHRTHLDVDYDSSLILMPSVAVDAVGAKLATVRYRNREAGLPAIHGVYVLFDRPTLAPRAFLEGAALTALRTPAVSFAAVRNVLPQIGHPMHVVIFGVGPQALGHFDALMEISTTDSRVPRANTVTFVSRRPADIAPASAPNVIVNSVATGTPEAADALGRADLVVCATSATSPLFDVDLLRRRSVVIAVGSHSPHIAEVEPRFTSTAQVIVEDVGTAERECGEIVQAIRDRHLDTKDLFSLVDVAHGLDVDLDRAPVFFKGSGMSWQDLAIANAIVRSVESSSPTFT